MAICGPALSLCGVIVSSWGILQLVLMGFFYYVRSLALSEDLPIDEKIFFEDTDHFLVLAQNGYSKNAQNCWIAACLYIFTLIFSAHQFYLNSRNSISM